MATLLFEMRDVLRSLRRDRAYALTVIFTLALTIGATTAVFSIVNGVLLESLARPDVVVLTDAAWRQRLAADQGAIGRSLMLDGKPHTIVGVLARDFQMPTGRLSQADLFVPIRMEAERVGWEGDHNNDAIG